METYNYSEFGSPDIGVGVAERELDILDKSYVKISADRYLLDKYVTFISGKKGSGKSALALNAFRSNEIYDGYKIYLKPNKDENSYINFSSMLDHAKTKWKGEENIGIRLNEISWRMFYLVNVMMHIIQWRENFPDSAQDSMNTIEKYLIDNKWIEASIEKKE